MIKQRSLLVALLLFPALLIAQVKFSKDFEVTKSTNFPVVDGASKEYFNDGKGHVISVKTDGEVAYIQRFDVNTMKEVGRKEYEDFPEYTKVQEVTQLGSKLFYIYTVFNKKDDKFTAYVREVNMDSGTFDSPKKLFTTEGPIVKQSPPGFSLLVIGDSSPHLKVTTSFDKSKLMINYRRKPLDKNDDENYDILGFFVYDNNFNELWGDEVKMPYTESDMNNLAYVVTKDGVAHMLAFLNESKRFELINIKGKTDVSTEQVNLDGKLLFQQFAINEDISGNLICSGFYANGTDIKVSWTGQVAASFNTNGILHFKMDTKGNVLETHNYEFPIDLINQNKSERAKEKNEKREEKGNAGIADVKMREVVLNKDGSITFVGEQYYAITTRNVSNGSTETDYYFKDVILTRVDASGKVIWMKKLSKNQVASKPKGELGIKFIQGKNDCYVLYIDNMKNVSLDINDVPETYREGKRGFLTAYKINNATGEVSRHTIFNVDDLNGKEIFQFSTTRIIDIDEKVFMTEVYMKGKEDAMIKMELLD